VGYTNVNEREQVAEGWSLKSILGERGAEKTGLKKMHQ